MNRITLEPGKRGGRPCIRGLRITVYDVLSMLVVGVNYLDRSATTILAGGSGE